MPGCDLKLDDLPRWNTWKFVGDEILLWADLNRHEEPCIHLRSLLGAVEEYERVLKKGAPLLGLKVSSWIATFPVPNVQVTVPQTDEAGVSWKVYDFLGPGIDLGFRVAKFSDSRRVTITAGLAKVIASLGAQEHYVKSLQLAYAGKERLKGVIGGRPYPLFWLDRHEDPQSIEDKLLNINYRVENVPVVMKILDEFFQSEPDQLPPFFPDDPNAMWKAVPDVARGELAAIQSDDIESRYEESVVEASQDLAAADTEVMPEVELKLTESEDAADENQNR